MCVELKKGANKGLFAKTEAEEHGFERHQIRDRDRDGSADAREGRAGHPDGGRRHGSARRDAAMPRPMGCHRRPRPEMESGRRRVANQRGFKVSG